MSEIVDERCGAPTENGPCTMKKGHSAEWHRHQVYETIEWKIFAPTTELLKSGSGRVGLQYALNEAFEVSDEIVVNIKNVYNGSSSNSD